MNKQTILIALAMLLLGSGMGYWLANQQSKELPLSTAKTQEESEPLFYRNPMNPSITSPVPAQDSMGMNYIPVYADVTPGTKEATGTVTIDPVIAQNIGVRTTPAKKIALSRTIRAVGHIDFDEERISKLHPKTEGWIEDLYINKTGEQVRKDDMLLSIYSPKLVATQQEYLLALNNLQALRNSQIEDVKKGAEDLVASSRERLHLFDVPEHQLQELENTHKIKKNLHIHSPVKGIVTKIGARVGQYVTPKTELYTIADLSKIWVYAEIFEYELPWVHIGDKVEMTVASLPGKTFQGKLTYIYPYASSKTRTVRVRLVFDNAYFLLKPDTFADVNIFASQQPEAVVIPAEAVIRSGTRDQVFIVRGPGKFEPSPVKLGLESEGQVIVLEGVQAGDEVVTSAQFMIDSESSLREATAKMMQTLQRDNNSLNTMDVKQRAENIEPDNIETDNNGGHQND